MHSRANEPSGMGLACLSDPPSSLYLGVLPPQRPHPPLLSSSPPPQEASGAVSIGRGTFSELLQSPVFPVTNHLLTCLPSILKKCG
jgi:hypothetical protein